MEQADTQPQKKGRIQRVKEFIRPPDPTKRIEDAYGIMKEVGGFRPLFNVRDLEQRRKEIDQILTSIEGKTMSRNMKKDVVDKTFKLFFLSGSPWYRGLDNRELTTKASMFLRLYNEIGCLRAFTSDLFMCSMQLLHLSFQALDVTNTPAYVISTTPMVLQAKGGAPRFQTPNQSAGGQQEREEPAE
jgi:hypothetical protein